MLFNSTEERSSQGDFIHKSNAKNVSKTKTKYNTHTAVVPPCVAWAAASLVIQVSDMIH